MMQLTARMVRAYKGAAISILFLLQIERKALTQAEMRRGTGYSDEAINEAVWMLREDGLIIETGRYTWTLPAGMRQLPLGASELPEVVDCQAVDKPVDNFSEEATEAAENGMESELAPDDPDLALNESMNESLTDSDDDDSFIHEDSSGISGPVTREKLVALGFYGRGLDDLLLIRGLTMREVDYHVEKSPNLGCALARIKKRQAVPAHWERAGPDENRSRYVGGEYADLINH